MSGSREISPLTLNRLSVYLRCLRDLQSLGVDRISSQEMADRYHLSSAQIRKDLAYFGEFGVRGVGYDVSSLAERLHALLGLDVEQRLIIVGMGHLGRALASYPGFNDGSFRVVAGVDIDPKKVGRRMGHLPVYHRDELRELTERTGARIAVIAVPAAAAQETLDSLVAAGLRTILNFAPVHLRASDGVRLKNVDMRIHLEEIAFHLGVGRDDLERAEG